MELPSSIGANVAMQARGHGRPDRVVLASLGGSNLKRARRTVPPDSPTLNHALHPNPVHLSFPRNLNGD